MKLSTIGFTKKSAERFFALLRDSGVERIVYIRLNPGGQLSGFAKGSDLAWFLKRLNGCGYVHLPELAPTPEILTDYRKDHDWARHVARFEATASCLLCSEPTPDQCHRGLIAERLAKAWPAVEIIHLSGLGPYALPIVPETLNGRRREGGWVRPHSSRGSALV